MISKKHKRKTEYPKQILPHRKCHCPYCHKPIKNVEAHIKVKHKKEL